jgi:serine protease Do
MEQQPQIPPQDPPQAPPPFQASPYQPSRKSRMNRTLAAAIIAIIICSLFAGVAGYYLANSGTQSKLNDLQNQVAALTNMDLASTSNNNTQLLMDNVSLSQLYSNIRDSVVVISDLQPQSTIFGQQVWTGVQGSGFVYNLTGSIVIVTNFHVINQAQNISVTFENGNAYSAKVLGYDAYADLAVLSASAPVSEYKPLEIARSSMLNVGDFVAAVGTPFGLAGSITTGIVSQLGRTITETTTGNYPIADAIQTSAAINPGNSGGPLLNAEGQVVGINTAGVSNSNNVGFAIPSDTILREITSLVNSGTYTHHPYLGVSMADMSYDIANAEGLNVTYGVLLEQVTSGGPADKAGLKAGTSQTTVDGNTIIVGGDIITAINGTRIVNSDNLSSYLEENALPGQTITITIVRNGQTMDIPLVLGTRPAAS